MSKTIEGVVIQDLVTHRDERGFFREVVKRTEPVFDGHFGQWSHSHMFTGAIKAWHWHRIQTDYWYVVTGVLLVGLCDMRKESPTHKVVMDFLFGDHQPPRMVKIPPGIAHGCKVIQGPVNLFYLTSHPYDPTDELRIPHDDPEIGYDWLRGPAIK